MKLRILHLCAAAMIASFCCVGLPVYADPVADFYRGKQIALYVAFPPGGGYDLYARAFARFAQKHIPGNPQITVKNMEGGNGVVAGSYITTVTPQNGLSLGFLGGALTLGKVMGGPGEFNPAKFHWIGRMTTLESLGAVWHTVPVRTIDDVKHRETVIAASVAADSSAFIPKAINDLVGTKFKIIVGYQGASRQALAMESGEVEAVSGVSWEAIRTTKRDWLDNKKVYFLFTFGTHRIQGLPDVPSLTDLATNERARKIMAVLGSTADIGRSIAAEPGIPPDRMTALRQAFSETMKDPDYLAFSNKQGLMVEPMPGDELQKVVASAIDTPPDVIEAAKKYFR